MGTQDSQAFGPSGPLEHLPSQSLLDWGRGRHSVPLNSCCLSGLWDPHRHLHQAGMLLVSWNLMLWYSLKTGSMRQTRLHRVPEGHSHILPGGTRVGWPSGPCLGPSVFSSRRARNQALEWILVAVRCSVLGDSRIQLRDLRQLPASTHFVELGSGAGYEWVKHFTKT